MISQLSKKPITDNNSGVSQKIKESQSLPSRETKWSTSESILRKTENGFQLKKESL